MGDLIAFLTARLDEDEHVARMAAEDASASANWHVDARYNSGSAGVAGENGEVVVYDEGAPAQMEAEHIARHDPARVLREVAAKRAIVEAYRQSRDILMDNRQTWDLVRAAVGAQRVIVTQLAAVWSDHADYRQEWAL